jgi:hypothetical protein
LVVYLLSVVLFAEYPRLTPGFISLTVYFGLEKISLKALSELPWFPREIPMILGTGRNG